MSRTTVAKVRVILPAGCGLGDAEIKAAIMAANCAVDQIAECCASDLNDDCLEMVETYLAAHFSAVTDNTLSMSGQKDGCSGDSVTYGFQFGEGVKGTPYGIMANTLSHGCLAQLDKMPVFLQSIGTL